jgi:hypothetical protein
MEPRNLRDAIRRFILRECVFRPNFGCAPVALCDDFCSWSGLQCTESDFIAALESCGFPPGEDGLVMGLRSRAEEYAAKRAAKRAARRAARRHSQPRGRT